MRIHVGDAVCVGLSAVLFASDPMTFTASLFLLCTLDMFHGLRKARA